MEQKLPNSQAVLILGILSIPLCCCYGIVGIVLGVVALVLAKKAMALYQENPGQYSGLQNVKTGKLLAIIGIVLGAIFLIFVIYVNFLVPEEQLLEWQRQLEEYQEANS